MFKCGDCKALVDEVGTYEEVHTELDGPNTIEVFISCPYCGSTELYDIEFYCKFCRYYEFSTDTCSLHGDEVDSYDTCTDWSD